MRNQYKTISILLLSCLVLLVQAMIRNDSGEISNQKGAASGQGIQKATILTTANAPLACAVTIEDVSVTGCYQNNGSKATVSVQVSWQDPPQGANDEITVQMGGQTRSIKLNAPYLDQNLQIAGYNPVASPQVVAFELPADGSNQSITAAFVSNNACSATSSAQLPQPCQPISCANGDLGGQVFQDYNANGVHESGETKGLNAVTVTAIACDGTTYPTQTDGFGNYTLNVPANKYPVRVEFTALNSAFGQGTPQGTDGQTTVQFVDAPECGVDLGVLTPSDYCQSTPDLTVPCYVNGDPVQGTQSGEDPALVRFSSTLSGPKNMGAMTMLAKAYQVGTLWGAAYNKFTNKLYSSATLKRHAGLGPLGIAGLYVSDLTSNTTSNFLDLSTLGINFGTVPSNAARQLPTGLPAGSNDPVVFDLIGKVGIGDIDISEDGSTLWFTNLFDKKLYALKLDSDNNSATLPTSADVTSYTIPSAGCLGGEQRPWAIKVYQGKTYVGVVCDASQSQSRSDLKASVFLLDPVGNTFTEAFSLPLTYTKGSPTTEDAILRQQNHWNPWASTFGQITKSGQLMAHATPIFSDIEFDIDGSMILSFADRTGFQAGHANYDTDPANTNQYTYYAGGDILRAYNSNGSYVLENNGKAGPSSGYGVGNFQGPGQGEFYNDDYVFSGATFHTEVVSGGGLAVRPGSGQVVVSTMDPVNNIGWSGGVRYMNNTTGLVDQAYVVYQTNNPPSDLTFGKAVGLGDLEFNCGIPTFIEIGNRAWVDSNKDGVQDACEPPLAGLNVGLYDANGALIGQTTTDANGNYKFDQLTPNTNYKVVFGINGQFNSNLLTIDNATYNLTLDNSTVGTGSDLNDSDAQTMNIAGGNYPTIDVTTGNQASVNHTLDAGFFCLNTEFEATTTPATCNTATGTVNSDGQINVSLVANGNRYGYSTGTTYSGPAYANATAFTGTSFTITGLANPALPQTYTVRVYNGPGCFKDQTVTLAPTVGCAPMPVRFSSFKGNVVDGKVLLGWTTSWEENNEGFSVQRGLDAKSFESIGYLKGKGNSAQSQAYEFTDAAVEPGATYYYRLQQQDFNGHSELSAIIAIRLESAGSPVTLFANPSEDGHFTLAANHDNPLTVKLITVLGTEIPVRLEKVGRHWKATPVQPVPAGIYTVVVLEEGQHKRQAIKLIVTPGK